MLPWGEAIEYSDAKKRAIEPHRQTLRERLNETKQDLVMRLNDVNKALDMLDTHPELESFQEALSKVGSLL
jgi:vacuolar-type H+-ATPase subunit E/Vma4